MNKTQIRNAKKEVLAEHLGVDPSEWTREEMVRQALLEREEAERTTAVRQALLEREKAKRTMAGEKTDEEEQRDAVRQEEEGKGQGPEEVEPHLKDSPDDVDPAETDDLEADPSLEDPWHDDPVNEMGWRLNEYARKVWNGQGTMPVSERVRRVIRALKTQGFQPDEIRDHLRLPVPPEVDVTRYISQV